MCYAIQLNQSSESHSTDSFWYFPQEKLNTSQMDIYNPHEAAIKSNNIFY
jgi:hypothetical protein